MKKNFFVVIRIVNRFFADFWQLFLWFFFNNTNVHPSSKVVLPIFSGNKLFRAFWGILPLFSEFFSQKPFLPFEKRKSQSLKFRRIISYYFSIFPNLKIEHHFRKPKNLTKIFLFFSPSKNNTNFFSFFSLFFSFVLHHTASLLCLTKSKICQISV